MNVWVKLCLMLAAIAAVLGSTAGLTAHPDSGTWFWAGVISVCCLGAVMFLVSYETGSTGSR